MIQRLLLSAFYFISLASFAKAGDPICMNNMTATPAWAESFKPNYRASDGHGHIVEFHYAKTHPRFLNIECSKISACAEHLLKEIKRKEPAFVSNDPALTILIRESLSLAEDWKAAFAITWKQEKDTTWSVRLSLDIPPAGKQIVQSEGIDIQEQIRVERIDIVVGAQQTDVSFVNAAAVEVGGSLVTEDGGSHSAGVILRADDPVPVIDSHSLRPQFFVGAMASASLIRALDTALVLVRAQRPDAEKVLLSGRRGTIAEHFNGGWIWLTQN